MAIFMRSGKTGTGKSFDAVHLVYKFWRNGREVYSNTPLFFTTFNGGFGGENIIENPEYFTVFEKYVINIARKLSFKLFKKEYQPLSRGRIHYFDTIDEIFYLKDCVILFDEGQTVFRNYDWENIPRLFLHKLEQNRKHGIDMVTTAQRVKAVNINYRELIQDWCHFETIIDLFGFHLFRKKVKDIDYITEDMQEQDIPNMNRGVKLGLLAPWTKRIYDTMYDIGFIPLKKYTIELKNERVNLFIETGCTVKQAIQGINMIKNIQKMYE